jgi:hypothetical protein
MALIQDNHVVKQLASATSNPALSNTVLPRTAKGRASWPIARKCKQGDGISEFHKYLPNLALRVVCLAKIKYSNCEKHGPTNSHTDSFYSIETQSLEPTGFRQ